MNYTTSRDYEKLWDLVQEGKEIVCWTDGKPKPGYAFDYAKTGLMCISGDQECFASSNCESFLGLCKFHNVEFIPPNEWIKIESDKDLPQDGQSVECVFRGKEVSHASWDKCLNKWDNGDYYWAKEDITHWKPLSEAPEVEA